MKCSVSFFGCALAVLLWALASGCVPPSQNQVEDEKEPHFIEGKHAVLTMDYTGAIEEFEKAVEANPRNASAHFELGMLYEEKEPDPAAAIYHYQQFLKLRPTADIAEAVRQRIMNCKQDLAKAVLPLPSSPGVQHDLEQLVQSNKQLVAELDQWRAWYKAQQTNRPQTQVAEAAQPTQTVQYAAPTATPTPASAPRTNPAPRMNPTPQSFGGTARVTPHTSAGRTYVVQPRDTLAAISRKFNVRLESLAAANPGLDPRRLRVGQTVNIP